jgi:iron complex outermembrane receptor protein
MQSITPTTIGVFMSFTKKPLCVAVAYAAAASMTLVAVDAFAQQSRERIEVTGTNIKRTDTETPSVVQVITREQIEKSGINTVDELLRQLPAINGGAAVDYDPGTGFQRGSSTASLRGLGSVATLVLLNGRRIAPSPSADPNVGQGTGFNLNTIPLSAIDRIEILKDGASAVYGSEAIAGVINIILRKDYRGAEATVTHAQRSDGGYRTDQVSGSVGYGDLNRDRFNVLISGEAFKRRPVWVRDSGSGIQSDAYAFLQGRGTPTSANSFPPNVRRESAPGSGAFLTSGRLPVDPNCPQNLRVNIAGTTTQECRFNVYDDLTVVSDMERKGVLGRVTFQLTPNVSAWADAMFSKSEFDYPNPPPGLSGNTPTTWFNREGVRQQFQLILPVGHPDNPNPFRVALGYRFVDIGETHNFVDQEQARATAGLEGTFGAWDWQTAVLFSRAKRIDESNAQLYAPALRDALSSGSYHFYPATRGANSQALLDSLHPLLHNEGVSKISSWDLKGSRELMQLRGGPAMVAAGLELRKEQLDIVSDPRTVGGDIVGLASSTVTGDRNVTSGFVEFSIPIVRNLETSIAGRWDHYSDFGNARTPKVGFKWLATPTLAARGTWGKGFRAPSLFQISSANVQSFNTITDPVRCPNGSTPLPNGETGDCTGRTISSLIQANTHVQPEKSVSHTLGVVWSPSNDFQASLDYYFIHRTNFIDRYDSQTVINNEFNGGFAGGTVQRDPNPATWVTGVPNSGPILSTVRRFDNFGDQVAAGFDLDLQWRFLLGAWGRLNTYSSWTYVDKNDWQFSKGVNYTGGAGNFFAFESPRIKGNVTAVWDFRDFESLVRYNYVGHWLYGDNENGCYISTTGATNRFLGGTCTIADWPTYDVGLTYKGIRNLRVSVLVRNVRDTPAPYDPQSVSLQTGFNTNLYNPYGRYFVFSVNYTFK